ncbi:hypothetical protein GOBAR_AA09745 [Gossypium barbadense]|uniref:DNA topoisomerase (ATP-hydrolyzing) n=1 Tax=Gossypium barbadense TaxID=3634 RepID=A0A2P5Y5M7_GOSBA|nr:hypothetical protein GOBAR_AA09745 [Gossypium barbadense]
MSLSATLRVSSFLRHKLFLAPSRASALRRNVSHLRFLSSSPSRRTVHHPVKARRGGGQEDDSGPGNGSLMAVVKDGTGDGRDGRVLPFELHKEAMDSYMAYALSVLLGRALPDVRDGLKPVHRRILYAMHELGLSSRKPFKKCARVVGEVLGKFHPHGDNAVYDSMVRMAQDFSLRFPLIQGHGNFGSIDADPPAAMRYTECRLEDMCIDVCKPFAFVEKHSQKQFFWQIWNKIRKVDFVPNFDNSQKEPSLLPARLPTLLLNGSSGIAVGMATNIPPHNLGELVDVLCALIRNPEASTISSQLDLLVPLGGQVVCTFDCCMIHFELLEYMPGPDFPTGGLIMGNLGHWVAALVIDGIRCKSGVNQIAYRTGRGRIVVRGKADIELLDSKTKRSAVIIKEVPYQTNKSSLVEKIAELVESKTLEGINDIRDESDRSGMRVVIELKRGADPSIVLNNLYRLTALQSSFNCNMVGILDGQPKQMGLKELLQAFLEFRCSVVERRARYKLSQAQDRRHIVEGIVVGLDNLDRVIDIIKDAKGNAAASAGLKEEFNLSDKQADAVLDISLRRLNLLELIEREALELKNKFLSPRRSILDDSDGGLLEDIDIIPNEEMLLAFSEKGYVKRMKPSTFNLQNRGTIGKSVGKLRVNDAMSDFIVCRSHDHVLYFRVGSCCENWKHKLNFNSEHYTCSCFLMLMFVQIRALSRNTRGAIAMRLKEGDKMASMDIIPAPRHTDLDKTAEDSISYDKGGSGPWLLFISENGYGKRVPLSSFKQSPLNRVGLIGYKFSSEDRLVAVFVVGFSLTDGESDEQVVLVSQSGTVNRIKVRDISIQSRYARYNKQDSLFVQEGVILMRLEHAGKIQSASLISASAEEAAELLPGMQSEEATTNAGTAEGISMAS